MRYAVGIDLGTTFTAAAVSVADRTRLVALSSDVVVPAVACHTPGGRLLTGTAAVRAAADTPGRLGRGVKRRLGDPTPVMLGGAAYSPAALMAAQLRDVLDQVTRSMGGAPDSVVLTCPAVWGPYRQEQFAEVPRLADVGAHRLITEPEAAARHYSRERTLGDGEIVAVYDLGGGTLDTTVLRMRSDDMEILGTPEGVEHLGGMDFDEALLGHLDARLGGAIGRLDEDDPADADALARIRALCVRAKIDLSLEPDVVLTVPLPSGPRQVTVTRLDFNAAIRPSVELTIGALRRTIASAGLRDEDLSAILLAGGASRVPLVTQMVFDAFDRPGRVSQHPKFTVALGAATVAAAALDAPPPAVAPPPAPPAPRAPAGPARRRWLVPAAAAALVVLATLAAALVVFAPDDGHAIDAAAGTTSATEATDTTDSAEDADATTTTTGAVVTATVKSAVEHPETGPGTTEGDPPPVPGPLVVFDEERAGPYRVFIASPQKWDGSEMAGDSVAHTAISARLADGLRVTWLGGAPAQVYLQSVNVTKDLSSYVDNDGALRFDVVVHSAGSGTTSVAAHCGYPCGAELNVTDLVKDLPVGEKTRVTIPLTCFTEMGLEETRVNTPFLVYAQGPLDATFSDIAWVPGAAHDLDALSCADLS